MNKNNLKPLSEHYREYRNFVGNLDHYAPLYFLDAVANSAFVRSLSRTQTIQLFHKMSLDKFLNRRKKSYYHGRVFA